MNKFKDSIHDIILGEKISDNIYLDNNGQLICENVVLARTGNYDYREDELLEDGSPEKIVQVYRSPEEVFDEESIKSMNYKPLVDEHPEDNVTPETVGELNKGFMTNVRRGAGEFSNCLMADLVITDPYVIDLVRSGKKRELSVGYTADILEENGQYVMKNIRGNHIALCEAGRAGNARIRDSRAKLDDATVEAKGSFNSLEELKKHYAGATVNKAGSKCEVTLRNGTKLLYSCLDGNKDGKLLFIRKLNDANTKVEKVSGPRGTFEISKKSEEELRKDGYGYWHTFWKGDKEYRVLTKNNEALAILKDSTLYDTNTDYLESLREMVRYEKPNTKAELKKVYKEWAAKEHHGVGYHDEFLKMCKEFNIEDAELPDPADEKELDRTHFIPDAKYKSGTVLKHVDGGKSEVISRVITESGVNGENTEKYLMKSGRKFVTEDIDTSKNWSEVMDSFEEGFDIEEEVNEELEQIYKDSLRPFRVSVGGRKFDTMATSFADAVQKVRSRMKDSLDFRGILDFYKNKGWLTWREVPNDKSNGVGYEVTYSKMPTAEVVMKAADKFGKHLISRGSNRLVFGDSDTARINDVYPNEGESKEDFISRFMSVTKEEYPDRDQRLAVAHSYWKKGVKDSSNSLSVKSIAEDLEKNYMIRVTRYSSSDNTIAFDKSQPRGQSVFGAIRYLYNKGINAEEIKPGIIKIKDSKFFEGVKDSERRIYSFVYRTNKGLTEKFSCEAVDSEDARDQLQEWVAMHDEEPIKVISKDMVYDSKFTDSTCKVSSNDFGVATMYGPTSLQDLEKQARFGEKVYLEYNLNGKSKGFWKSASVLLKQLKSGQMKIIKVYDSKSSDSEGRFAILHPTRNEFLSVGGRSWVKEDSTNIQKFSSYDEALEFGRKYVTRQFRIFKFFDSKFSDHDSSEMGEEVENAPKEFQLREYVGDLIDDEVEAVKGYDKTLLRTDLDESTRAVLEEIRNEELDHTDKLNKIYKNLTKDSKPVEDDMYGLVKEPKFRYFKVTVLEKSAKWGDEELNYFVRAKDESEARKKVTGNIVRIVESNHSEYLKAKHHGMVVDAGMVGYLFPKLNRNDLLNAYKYGLGLGAVNPFKGEEGTFLLGSLENIKKYAEDYLDYELVKGYLVKGKSLTHDSVSKFDLAKFTSDPETSYTLIGNSEERIELSEKDEKNSKLINALKSAGFKQKNSWLFVRG